MTYLILNPASQVFLDYAQANLLPFVNPKRFLLTLAVATIGVMSASVPYLMHLIAQVTPIESTRLNVQVWVSLVPWFGDRMIDVSILISGALLMAFVPDFWAVVVNTIHAIRYGLSFQWFYHAPFSWFDSHVMLAIQEGPIANSFGDSSVALLLLIPLLGFIALPYDPFGTINMMLIFVCVLAMLIPVGMALELLKAWGVQRWWDKLVG